MLNVYVMSTVPPVPNVTLVISNTENNMLPFEPQLAKAVPSACAEKSAQTPIAPISSVAPACVGSTKVPFTTALPIVPVTSFVASTLHSAPEPMVLAESKELDVAVSESIVENDPSYMQIVDMFQSLAG